MRILPFFLLLILSACGQSDEFGEAQLTPEQVSLGFFEAIYVDRDVDKAKKFVSTDIQEIMDHYHIASAVQRHVLGLSMKQVTMSIDEIDIDFFRKFTDDVTVVVKMQGLKGGRDWIDDRTIRLHKIGNTWVIVEILTEKGRIEG
ncbi:MULTISPECIES: DUF4878 domain-containing protein [Shewanella]|uniref:DUF4878 domain-containing protein n=1 Tax=Shewanella TaxID=22 RepID=UPI0015FFD3FA|nr:MULTISPECIES: DUF4878 domain-containing protein [Shewanella]NCQ43906.1 hypothetical protein [Shewanella frigidimarina]MBB1388276.1 hypothetical protein [Shewanella sp. SG44-6]NCO70280.1 hypothetical protein [Shewanella vesiculosa]NCP37114.1 hypothetical protein [Shewanella vesiculosa]NCP68401.1 hypothetical protein [Shewanella vesiculosa]